MIEKKPYQRSAALAALVCAGLCVAASAQDKKARAKELLEKEFPDLVIKQ
jgi:hypothetical protein